MAQYQRKFQHVQSRSWDANQIPSLDFVTYPERQHTEVRKQLLGGGIEVCLLDLGKQQDASHTHTQENSWSSAIKTHLLHQIIHIIQSNRFLLPFANPQIQQHNSQIRELVGGQIG